MVGGALPADQTIARHVVLIIGGNNVCTGVAVAPDLVLTAAHCVLANGRYRLVVFDGRRPAVKDIATVAPHPQFSPRADAPDLALVKLAAPPAANLAPAAFSERRTPPAVGDRPMPPLPQAVTRAATARTAIPELRMRFSPVSVHKT